MRDDQADVGPLHEDLDALEADGINSGPMKGVPAALEGLSLFRFGEEELSAHVAELLSECEAAVSAHRRAAGLWAKALEEDEDLFLDEGEPGGEEAREGVTARAGAARGPVIALAEAEGSTAEELWIALEALAGYKRLAAVLVRAAGVELLRMSDRGVVDRRGEAVAVSLLGTEEPQEEMARHPPRGCPFGAR